MNAGKLLQGYAMLAAALWAGGMWAVGYIAAPVLFQLIPDSTVAGQVAAQMFAASAYVGMFCAVTLLLVLWRRYRGRLFGQRLTWLICVMLLITLLGQYGLQPLLAGLKQQALPLPVMQSAFAGQFRMWHGISSMLFLLQSLLAAGLVLKISATAG